ncbi:MAG: hypothetical protein QNJ60_04385 [Xenococcaceae cyanobacterium MO_188.B19]|nr:hypothetical protein [Xenococcaceae cyanobacterium MO_188.B19]
MKQYLAVTETINWQHPKILQLAHELSQGKDNVEAIAQRLAKSEIVHSYGKIAKAGFEWVRDQIFHSSNYKINPVTKD